MRAIVSVCDDWAIGYQGQLLVHNPVDMRAFVKHTTGGVVIMGRATLESLPAQKPLPRRRNIVLSRRATLDIAGIEQVRSIAELLELVSDVDDSQLWVIGGEQVYRALLPYCTEVLVTKHDCIRAADAFFPNLDEDTAWILDAQEEGGTTAEGVAFSFLRYRRVQETSACSSTEISPRTSPVPAL